MEDIRLKAVDRTGGWMLDGTSFEVWHTGVRIYRRHLPLRLRRKAYGLIPEKTLPYKRIRPVKLLQDLRCLLLRSLTSCNVL